MKETVTLLQKKGLLPVMRIPITVEGKEELSMDLFSGNNVSQVASKFILDNGISPDLAPRILREIKTKAQEAKVMPVHEIPVSINGKIEYLPLYYGDEVKKAVDSWAKGMGLIEEDAQKLTSRVVQLIAGNKQQTQ